ncbi:hypothetical protein SNL152K_10728 [Streptomyces sp. NL15-2K]|nr:hypothetical protein SNL152K_10728 [Streptomyces sp. NL15-2K]
MRRRLPEHHRPHRPLGKRIQPQQLHTLDRRHMISQDEPHPGIGHHERQPLHRIPRIQRHIRTPRPQHRQHRHHHIHRPRQTHTHPRLHTHTSTPQHPSQPLHPLTQLPIRQRHIPTHHRHRTRTLHHPLPEQLHHRPHPEHTTSNTPPLHPTTGQQHPTHRHTNPRHQPLSQHQPIPTQPLHRHPIKQVSAEADRSDQPALTVLLELQGHVELGRLPRHIVVDHAQSGQLEGRTGRVLQGHHRLNERRAAGVPLRRQLLDQTAERHVLMRERIQNSALHFLQQFTERAGLVDARAQHQRVDEEPDQFLQLRPLPPGDRRRHRHIPLSAVAGEQQLRHRRQRHEQTRADLPARLSQPRHQLRRYREHVHRTRSRAHRRTRTVRRQLQRLQPRQLLPPVAELSLQRIPGQPLPLPHRIVPVLHRQPRQHCLLTPHRRRVQRAQLTRHHPHRPAIGDDVMQRQHQHVLRDRLPHHQHPHQRTGPQVERSRRLTAQCLLGFTGNRCHDTHRHLQRRMHPLHPTPLHRIERRPQHLVPRDQTVHCRLQRRDIEVTTQPQARRDVVLRAAGREVVQEPQPLLRERQRQHLTIPTHWDRPGLSTVRTALLPHDRCEIGNGRGVEESTRREIRAEGHTDAGGHLQARDGVPAQLEEVVVDTDPLCTQHLGPDAGQPLLDRRARGDVLLPRVELGHRQGAAVDLAVRRQRQRLQHHEHRRHHVLRQNRGQMRTHRLQDQFPALRRGHVRHQALHTRLVLTGHHRGDPYARTPSQGRFHLTQLNTEPANLDLVVTTPQELQPAVRPPAHHIPGSVQALTRHERIRHEPLRRQAGLPGIAPRQAVPAQIQLTRNTDSGRPQPAIEHVRAGVVHPDAQGHHARGGLVVGKRAGHRERGRLRRPVPVDQHRPPTRLQHPRRRHRRHRIPARPHLTQAPETLRVLLHQDPEQRRRHPHPGHAIALHRLPHHRHTQLMLRHHHTPAVQQRHPHLIRRRIKRMRRVEQHPPMRPRPEPLIGRQRHHRTLRDRHTLRPTRRTGREHHIRQRIRRSRNRQQRTGLGTRLRVHRHQRHTRIPRQVLQRPVRHHQTCTAVLHHLPHPLSRERGVHRHIRRFRLQHAQHRHQRVHRPPEQQRHPRLDSHPLIPQHMSKPLRPLPQLPVGQHLIPAHHRHRTRTLRHPLGKHLHHRTPRRHHIRARPFVHHQRRLGLVQQIHRTERNPALARQPHNRPLQPRRQTLHRRRVEQRGIVSKRHVQAVGALPRHQSQRVSRRLHHLDVPQLHPATGGRFGIHWVVLEHHKAVEEADARRQIRLDVRQRHILVLPRLDLLPLKTLQPLPHRLPRSHIHTHRERVDEQPDHVLRPRQISGPPGHRRPEHHIPHARTLRQHQRPGTFHHHTRRHPIPPRKRPHPLPHLTRQRHHNPLTRLPLIRPLRNPVERQPHRLPEPRQHPTPELPTRHLILPAQPLHIIPEIAPHNRLPTSCSLPAQRRVFRQYIRQECRAAPAVHQQMMERPHHPHRRIRQPHHSHPHQRRRTQLESPSPVLRQKHPQPLLLHHPIHIRPVQRHHRHPHLTVHHLHRLTQPLPHHRHPQRIRTPHHPLPRPTQQTAIPHTLNHKGQLLHICTRTRLRQGMKYHPRLQRSQRINILHIPPVPRQRINLLLRQRNQREIRRRTTPDTHPRTMLRKRHQLSHEILGQPPHRRLVMQTSGIGPGKDEAALVDACGDVQDVGALCSGAVFAAGVEGGGQVPGGVATGGHVYPSEVVEGDLRLRGIVQYPAGALGSTEVAQRAVAHAPVRHRAQLLLHGLHRGCPVSLRGEFQSHGVERGEPACRAGEVEVVEELLAAVALQVHRHPVIAGPGAQGAGERGQEHLVDLGAVGGRCAREQDVGALRGQGQEDGPLRGDAVVAAGRVEGEVRAGAVGDGSPVGQLVVEASCRRVDG